MSNRKCCVPGCKNSSESEEILHKFPNPDKEKELFNTWVYAIGGDIPQLENNHIFKYRRVCHIHFEQKYCCRSNRLSNIAVPTKNMPGLSLQKFGSQTCQITTMKSMQTSGASTSKGLSLSKFGTERPALRCIQTSEVSTSTVPDPMQLIEIGPMQLTESIVEDVQMKENIEPDDVTKNLLSLNIPLQTHIHSVTADDKGSLENQSLQKVSRPKKRVKHVAVSPAERALYKKLLQVGVKLSKCRNKIRRQAVKIKSLQNITNNPQFSKILNEMPSTSKILTLLQFRERNKSNKGRRFTLKEKIVALSILKQSPKGYRFLRRIFILPSRQSLLKLINMADINPGVNENIVKQIKKASEAMKLEHKLCILLFDEMSIKANVSYNERKDRVSGFVTNGHETYPEYADHAQVFMVRGIIKNYKQPVAYTFSQGATKGLELAKQLKNVVTKLQDAGLIVVATVCDQGTNNVHCIKHLVAETRGIFLRKGEEPRNNIILINGKEIIPLYDPPHLIKCVRNNLISKDLKYIKDNETKIAKWSHIMLLHKENPGYKGIRLMPKLTDAHCDPNKIPRMKVKYATQLFSQTVASNMGYLAEKNVLPLAAKDTADLLLFFDRLFDSVNGSYGKRKKYGKNLLGPATPTSIHTKLWRESITMLQNMHFINRVTLTNEYVPTLNNWIWTLDGIKLLLERLRKYGITSVWLRHLNQDPIENFFGSIRSQGCRNINPTPDRFESAFTTLLINSLSSVHAPGSNCEIDECYALHEVLITGEGSKEQIICELNNIPDITLTPLEDKNDPREIGGLQYVTGYFLKSAKAKVFKGCSQCKNDLMSSSDHEYIRYREYANKKWLCSPSNSLLDCISNLQDITYTILKENLEKNHIKELVTTVVLMSVEFDFINCEFHKKYLIDFLIKISCRFFIYNYCKDLNKILLNKRDCDDDTDQFKIKAKKYAKKCFKRKNK